MRIPIVSDIRYWRGFYPPENDESIYFAMLVSRGIRFHKFGREEIVFPNQKVCPYCYPYKFPMKLEIPNENERIWRCLNPEYSLIRSFLDRPHDIHKWKCGLCGRFGSENMVVDDESPTGHAHAGCRDRELLHWICSCGFEEYTQRGSGFSIFIRPKHSGEGHDLKVERTFKLGGKRITTTMGREITIEE